LQSIAIGYIFVLIVIGVLEHTIVTVVIDIFVINYGPITVPCCASDFGTCSEGI